MLTDDGFIVLTKTQPLRYAVDQAEQTKPLPAGDRPGSTRRTRARWVSRRGSAFGDEVVIDPNKLVQQNSRRKPSSSGTWGSIGLRSIAARAPLAGLAATMFGNHPVIALASQGLAAAALLIILSPFRSVVMPAAAL